MENLVFAHIAGSYCGRALFCRKFSSKTPEEKIASKTGSFTTVFSQIMKTQKACFSHNFVASGPSNVQNEFDFEFAFISNFFVMVACCFLCSLPCLSGTFLLSPTSLRAKVCSTITSPKCMMWSPWCATVLSLARPPQFLVHGNMGLRLICDVPPDSGADQVL